MLGVRHIGRVFFVDGGQFQLVSGTNQLTAFGDQQALVASGQDRSLPLAQRNFAYMPYMPYMPYMHSESALVHAQAVVLFAQPGMEDTLRFEQRHQAIILTCHPSSRPG
ncbi:DUF924 family protein [Limnohabitans sp. 2KL-3]|uniref:DUF924 family protein n=1 Tax=Limnohabitans sp. 2KL-3 TaxID=1100700 RepID=UPI000B16F335